MISKWFKGKEIGLAVGLLLSLSTISLVFSDLAEPILYQNHDLTFVLWLGFLFSSIALLASFILIFIDLRKRIENPNIYEDVRKKIRNLDIS